MPRFTGILTIVDTNSDLSGTRLAKGSTGNVFGEATRFLEQDRGLRSGNRIFVDGTPRTIGGVSAISITNAGRELPAIVSANGVLRAFNAAKGLRSRSARKGAAKKSAAKKGAAKKGAAKKRAAKKATKRNRK